MNDTRAWLWRSGLLRHQFALSHEESVQVDAQGARDKQTYRVRFRKDGSAAVHVKVWNGNERVLVMEQWRRLPSDSPYAARALMAASVRLTEILETRRVEQERLAEAAPDLLRALEGLHGVLIKRRRAASVEERLREAERAIERATGRTPVGTRSS